MSLLERDLPEPAFVEHDPARIVADVVAEFEAATGRTLYPAQVERFTTNIIAYRESLIREAIQDAAKLNLLRYSRAPVLDMIGELVGVARLAAAPAGCILAFAFDASPLPRTLPAGTQVLAGSVAFATSTDMPVPAGASGASGRALCTAPGAGGNGFVAGQINLLAAPVAGFANVVVANISTSAGGAELEDDDGLRTRIALAPERFSTAGPSGAYEYWARSAWPGIADVAVVSPKLAFVNWVLVSQNGVQPGEVRIYPLMASGLPAQAVLDAVQSACSAKTVRPLCDTVRVLQPEVVHTSIAAVLTLYEDADPVQCLAAAQAAAAAYVATMQARLGRDVVLLQIADALKVPGVYDVALAAPSAAIVLEAWQWPVFDAVTVTVGGTAHG